MSRLAEQGFSGSLLRYKRGYKLQPYFLDEDTSLQKLFGNLKLLHRISVYTSIQPVGRLEVQRDAATPIFIWSLIVVHQHWKQ